MLVTSAYTPDQDAHDFITDVSANEVAGAGYTAGGATLASVTVTQDNTNNRVDVDATDPTWAASTITARGAVIYKDTGTPATSPLIVYLDFGSDKVSTGGEFKVTFNAAGFLRLA